MLQDYDDLEEAERNSSTRKENDSLARPPLTIEEWRRRKLPDPDFLSGCWATTTSRIALVAPTGIGKTMFVIHLGISIAAGLDFLHWKGRRPARVLYLDGEMSRRLLRERVIDAAKRVGSDAPGFCALSHEDIPNFAPLNTHGGRAQVERFIEEMAPDLIIFDSVMCLILGDMKEEAPWNETMPWVRSLTQRSVGQIWVNHTGHDETRQYGTKTREWQMDTVLFLEPVKRKASDVCFNLDFRKARERTPETRSDFRAVRVALQGDVWNYEDLDAMLRRPPSPIALKFLDALNNVLAGSSRMTAGRRVATSDTWKDECVRLGLIDTQSKPDSARSLFSKYRRELVVAGRVACDGDISWAL